MSLLLRAALAVRLSYNNVDARFDVLDPRRGVRTETIAMLDDIARRAPHHILVTALKSDHHDDSALGAWSHYDGGAVDCYNADWSIVGDARVLDIMTAAVHSPWCWTIGMGGYPTRFYNQIRDLAAKVDSRIIVFTNDGNADLVHLQAGNVNGSGARA